MKTIDFKKEQKELYSATQKVKEVTAAASMFLAVDGKGEPGGDAFQKGIEALFSVAYTTKFALKYAGVVDFKVSTLECLWDVKDPQRQPMSEWGWSLLIRIPESFTAAHLKMAQKTLHEKKGLDASAVKRRKWKEGRCVQVMHVGPYEKVGEAYQKMWLYANEHGLEFCGLGHEVYLSDPRRTAPAKLKTIVRMPVRKKK